MVLMNRVRVVWTGVAGTPWYSNYYTIAGAISPSTAHAAVNSLQSSLKALYVPALTATIEGDIAQVESSTNEIVGVVTVPATGQTGTASGTMLPRQTQALVRLLTGAFSGGRQVRGRVFVPGLAVGAIGATGQVASGTLAALNTAYATYLSALGPGAVVFSRKNGTAVPIIAASTWGEFATMRSRRD